METNYSVDWEKIKAIQNKALECKDRAREVGLDYLCNISITTYNMTTVISILYKKGKELASDAYIEKFNGYFSPENEDALKEHFERVDRQIDEYNAEREKQYEIELQALKDKYGK